MRRPVVLLLLILAACAPAAPTAEVAIAPSRILDFWQPVTAALNVVDEIHPWQFIGEQGDAIRIRITGQSAGVSVLLQAPDGSALSRGNDMRVTLPSSGVYTALVRLAQGDPSTYTLALDYTDRPDPAQPTPTVTPTRTVTPTPTPTPPFQSLGALMGRLPDGGARDGRFDGAGERHVYLFDGEADKFVNVLMARISGRADPSLTLYDPEGNAIAFDDNSGGDGALLLRNIRLPETGLYSIQASGDGLVGDYRITLTTSDARVPVTPNIPQPTGTATITPTPVPRPDRLTDHAPLTGRIERPGDFARYPIAALVGEVFTIGVSPIAGSSFRPEIELYNPYGELVYTANVYVSNAGGDAVIPAFRATESGTYIALVQAEGDGTGDYVIAYGLGASREDVPRGVAQPDANNAGEVARRGLGDVWTIYLNRDDIISASVSPVGASFDPALDLIAPDGSRIASDDNSGGGRAPLLASIRAPMSGAYALRVTGANAGSSGTYNLVWRYVVAAPAATLPAATVLLLSADDVAPELTYMFYPFQGQAGQRILVRVRARPDSGLDPVAALVDANGAVLAQADDNGEDLNPVLEITLPDDGTYTVRVNGYGESSGAFELTVEVLY